ncbi:acyltransferase family protein [Reyranella soli]|jgi:peptidoglycan/LPS O-acetylase OafA/YrhL|nr:acyltransferase [Reyranella soli]
MASVKREEIQSLTGLRGVAALLVVIAHYWSWTKVTPQGALPDMPWAGAADIGMAIFFTLSGYVIALSYSHWDWRDRPAFNLIRLFFYRFARLYPAYLVFVVIAILTWPDIQDLSDPAAQSYVVPHLLLWQSWMPVKYGGELVSNAHFNVSWSLSVECALYLAFGLGAIVVALLPAWRFRSFILGVAGFYAIWLLVDAAWLYRQSLMPAGWSDGDWYLWLFHFSPFTVALQFLLGVGAFRATLVPLPSTVARLASELGLIGLITVQGLTIAGRLDHSNDALPAAIATVGLLIGARSGSIANRLLSGRAIVYLGTISYSLYLFHPIIPPMALHNRFFETYSTQAAAFHAVNFVSSIGLAIIFATGVYRLIEVPGRQWIRARADRLLGVQRSLATPVLEGTS